jgi:hypothetical protein
MPIYAECLFCRFQTQVPDQAVGMSVKCPKCKSFFTMAPIKPSKSRSTKKDKYADSSVDAPNPVSGTSQTASATIDPTGRDQPVEDEKEVEPDRLLPQFALPKTSTQLAVSPSKVPSGFLARQIDFSTFLVILLGGGALGFAQSLTLAPWVIPIAILGLLMGVITLFSRMVRDQAIAVIVAGTSLNALILFAAMFFPGLLGPTYELSRSSDPEPDRVRVIPFPGQSPSLASENPDWIDASKASLQSGNVQVQVVNAKIVSEPKKGKTKSGGKKFLVIRLSIKHMASGSEFTSDQWSTSGLSNSAPQIVLTDDLGRTYSQQPSSLKVDTTSKAMNSSTFPIAGSDPAFVFEAPSNEVNSLRLEVSSVGWGSKATFRFLIPSSMFRNDAFPFSRP